MSIPAVNVTVVDGALGIVPATAANVQVKLGYCQKASASVAASVLIPSTTMSDGVTFTAVAAGAGGNQISITYTTGASASPVVSVVGNAITVQIKAGTSTNANVVSAVAGFAAAAALVTGVATGASDLAIAASQTFLTGGVNGTINTLFSETNPQQALTDLGYGPLTEAVVHSLQVAGGTVLAMPIATSVAGTTSAIQHAGSGSPSAPSVSGNPYDSYNAVILITAGGALGAAQFQYSLDGGKTYSLTYTVPSGGTFAIPNTGLTYTFGSGTYVAADTYSFQTTAPASNLSDIQAGFNALLALPNLFAWAHVVGPAATTSGSASIAAGVETLMESFASAFKYAFAVIECPDDTDANIESAFASTSTLRVMVCAGSEKLTSSLLADQPNRNCAFSVTARMALVPPQEDIGRVARGAMPGIVSLNRDEQATPALDALDFTTMRTIPGLTGFYATGGHMFVAPTSDYSLAQNRRVMDIACTIARQGLLNFLNDTIQVNASGASAGHITEANAQKIENYVGGQLNGGVVAPGYAIAASIVVDRTNNVLSTKTLNVTVRITPFGYAKTINATLAFFNPALQPT